MQLLSEAAGRAIPVLPPKKIIGKDEDKFLRDRREGLLVRFDWLID
jgi:hypothetical protein